MDWDTLLAALKAGDHPYEGDGSLESVLAFIKAKWGIITTPVPVVVAEVPHDIPVVITPAGDELPIMTLAHPDLVQKEMDIPYSKLRPLLKQWRAQRYPSTNKLNLTVAMNNNKLIERLAVLEQQNELGGANAKLKLNGKQTKAHGVLHPVKTHLCLEDDPCLGYPEWDACGFGLYMADVCKSARAHKAGAAIHVPEKLKLANEIMVTKATGLSTATDDEGGFLTTPEFQNRLLKREHEVGLVFSRAQAIAMGSATVQIPAINETSRADGSRQGGVRARWVEEGGTLTSSQPTFRRVQLTAHKINALGYMTAELIEDSPISMSIFGELFPEEMAFKIDDAVVNGDGSGKPLGFLQANCLVTISKEEGQSANTIKFENVNKMWARMWARSRANAVWFINQDCEPQLNQMALVVGTGGVPVYMPATGVSGAPFSTLYGRPVIPIEQAATLGTVGDINLVDMSAYLYGTRGGMKTASSIHVQFLTEEEAFRVTQRVDGQPWWNAALTPFKGTANTLSPFVALATRA